MSGEFLPLLCKVMINDDFFFEDLTYGSCFIFVYGGRNTPQFPRELSYLYWGFKSDNIDLPQKETDKYRSRTQN